MHRSWMCEVGGAGVAWPGAARRGGKCSIGYGRWGTGGVAWMGGKELVRPALAGMVELDQVAVGR